MAYINEFDLSHLIIKKPPIKPPTSVALPLSNDSVALLLSNDDVTADDMDLDDDIIVKLPILSSPTVINSQYSDDESFVKMIDNMATIIKKKYAYHFQVNYIYDLISSYSLRYFPCRILWILKNSSNECKTIIVSYFYNLHVYSFETGKYKIVASKNRISRVIGKTDSLHSALFIDSHPEISQFIKNRFVNCRKK